MTKTNHTPTATGERSTQQAVSGAALTYAIEYRHRDGEWLGFEDGLALDTARLIAESCASSSGGEWRIRDSRLVTVWTNVAPTVEEPAPVAAKPTIPAVYAQYEGDAIDTRLAATGAVAQQAVAGAAPLVYTQDDYRNGEPVPACLVAHVALLAVEDMDWRRAAQDWDEESLAFRYLLEHDWVVETARPSPSIPAVCAQYEGDAIDWPADRTTAGYVNSAKVRQERADAARRNDARHRAYRARVL